MIPFGQPVLFGHHSQRRHERDLGRIDRAMLRSAEDRHVAALMTERADTIEAAIAASIYSGNPEAIEQLERRIA